MKRVYKSVGVEAASSGWIIRLDRKELRSPAGRPLTLPTSGLAEAIAAEWDSQTGDIRPDTMPLMQFAATAVDLVADNRPAIVASVAAYAETDLVCYRAAYPAVLVARQEAAWGPLIAWIRARYDAHLSVHTGIMPRPQPEATVAALRNAVEARGDWSLSVLQTATGAAGSLVIGLALIEERLDADEAFTAAQLDETFEIEQWGEDAEATARRARLRADLTAARRFADLLAQAPAGG